MPTNEQPINGILEDFRLDFLGFWQRLPDKTVFFVLLAAWFALFQFIGNSTLGYVNSPSLFKWTYSAYQSKLTEDAWCVFVPVIVLALMWWKRDELLKQPLRMWWPGLLMIGLAVFFHLVGFAGQQPKVSIVAFFVGIYGMMGLVWGPAFLRASFFPFCLFVFSIPLGDLATPITFRLRLLVCQLVEGISHYILQVDILREGTALKDPTGKYQYEVAAACSGIRSLIAIIGLGVAYGMLAFRSHWKRGLIIASAFPLAIMGNTLRMLFIVIASEIAPMFHGLSLFGMSFKGDPQEWGNYVHEGGPVGIFSLLPYILAFVGMFAIGYWLGDKKAEPVPGTSPAAAPAAPSTPAAQPT